MKLYWVNLTYLCAGLLVDSDGVIVGGAPIFNKYKGRTLLSAVEYWYRKGYLINLVEVTD